MNDSSNILPMPTRKSPHRQNARAILKAYYAKKRRGTQAPVSDGLTQSEIDGRQEGWERESE